MLTQKVLSNQLDLAANIFGFLRAGMLTSEDLIPEPQPEPAYRQTVTPNGLSLYAWNIVFDVGAARAFSRQRGQLSR